MDFKTPHLRRSAVLSGTKTFAADPLSPVSFKVGLTSHRYLIGLGSKEFGGHVNTFNSMSGF